MPDSNSRIRFTRPILTGLSEDILDLIFTHIMVLDMWKTGLLIKINLYKYFNRDGNTLAILLGGGTKKRQHKDIETAKTLWKEYKRRMRQES